MKSTPEAVATAFSSRITLDMSVVSGIALIQAEQIGDPDLAAGGALRGEGDVDLALSSAICPSRLRLSSSFGLTRRKKATAATIKRRARRRRRRVWRFTTTEPPRGSKPRGP